jgi:hypothetical protein
VEEGAEEEEEDVLDKGNFFGYVDENGNVVYVDMDQDEDEADNMIVIPNLDSENVNIDGDSSIIENNNNDNNSNNDDINNTTNINNYDDIQMNNTNMEIDENTLTLESVSLQLTKMEFKSEPSQKHGKKIDKYKKLPNISEKFNPGMDTLLYLCIEIYTYLYYYIDLIYI